ncbi:MAG: PQQ-binding-like beta-propeller repeat protein [Spirochaetales bacterium]|nr:PQQ-binding-like beta-propeller repeat protein [Spirochaetales bacterium]
MKQSITRLLFIISSVIFIFACTEQGVQRTNYISDKDMESGNISLEYNQALVVYSSGDVEASVEDAWQVVEVGDFIVKEQSVKVGSGSFCELQFGEKAVIRVEENTKVSLSELFLKAGETDIRINVEVGTVLCKVNSLSEGEKFKVRTKTAVCGVRGTQFGVSVSPANETALSVREGKVAVLPASVDVEKLKETAGKSDETIMEIIEQLEDSAPIVGADQEVVLTQETTNETEASFVRIEQEVEKIAKKDKGTVTKQERDNLRNAITQTTNQVKTNVDKPQKVSEERKERLDTIETIKMHKIPVVSRNEKDSDSGVMVKNAPQLIRIGIKAVPNEASIFLENRFIGFGKFQGLYSEGEKLKVRVEKTGYVPQTLFIDVEKSGRRFFEVKLETEKQDRAGKDTVQPETQKDETRDKIKDNENNKIKDDKQNNDRPDREVSTEKRPDKSDAQMKPEIAVVKPASNSFIGDLSVHGQMLFAADKSGTVYALNPAGRVVWTAATTNNPNHNSSPVVIGDRVFFSGQREMVILNASNGQVLARNTLDAASNHMFGRRVVKAGNAVLMPTDKSIRVLNSLNGALIKEIPVPGSSRMSPAVYKGKIYIVNSLGSVQIIDIETGAADPKPIITGAVEPVAISISVFGSLGYFAGRKNQLVCFNFNSNQVVWEKKLVSDDYPYQNVIAAKEGVYVLSGTKLFGFAHNGAQLFSLTGMSAAPGYTNGRVYAAKANKTIQVLNAANGKVISEIPLESKITTRPVLWNGKIVAGTENGQIVFMSAK